MILVYDRGNIYAFMPDLECMPQCKEIQDSRFSYSNNLSKFNLYLEQDIARFYFSISGCDESSLSEISYGRMERSLRYPLSKDYLRLSAIPAVSLTCKMFYDSDGYVSKNSCNKSDVRRFNKMTLSRVISS